MWIGCFWISRGRGERLGLRSHGPERAARSAAGAAKFFGAARPDLDGKGFPLSGLRLNDRVLVEPLLSPGLRRLTVQLVQAIDQLPAPFAFAP
jgi:hypothetical protein